MEDSTLLVDVFEDVARWGGTKEQLVKDCVKYKSEVRRKR